jgi:hypothetical protein
MGPEPHVLKNYKCLTWKNGLLAAEQNLSCSFQKYFYAKSMESKVKTKEFPLLRLSIFDKRNCTILVKIDMTQI